ncbi:MAG: hypothetical protein SNJ82_01550 [Gemmataceae bacterium]
MKNGWITRNQLPELLKRLEDSKSVTTRYVEVLAILKAPESFEPLALYLDKNPFAHTSVRDAFIGFGPPAEETAMKLVGHRTIFVHRTALEILGAIGTSKSLNALTKAAPVLVKLHPSCQQQLHDAIAQIKARQKK